MNTVLIWLVPPLVGAIIGFLTNVLAIKMLFRPLRACYIGSFRLPFTPGILPRERAVLAKSIGAMVARELLTPEIIRKRLEADDVKQFAQDAAAKFAEKIDESYPKMCECLVKFFRKPEVHREIEAFGHNFLSRTLRKLNPVQKFLVSFANYDQKFSDKMPEIVDDFIDSLEELFWKDNVRNRIRVFIEAQLGASVNAERLIAELNGVIPDVLQKFDIASIVEDRINSLPMERVEGIVLDVMADKFKWIDIFGAILGFLIGIFQAVFSFMVNRW
jgi:uncharacterized membrane protein YheB (UPF0754 family)